MSAEEYLSVKEILKNMRTYNKGVACSELFGFDPKSEYDALVVAPGWKPDRMLKDPQFTVMQTAQHAYISGYELQYEDKESGRVPRIAWMQCASGATNLVDHLLACGDLSVKRLIFAGAAGGLTERFEVGDVCTPSACVCPNFGPEAYLRKKLPLTGVMPVPHIDQDSARIEEAAEVMRTLFPEDELKTGTVFCTDSIILEYSHLKEILKTGAELIEMETAAFLRVAPMFDLPYYILLAVSDNSATKKAMIGADKEEERWRYLRARGEVIPRLIAGLCLRQPEIKEPGNTLEGHFCEEIKNV